jgi:DNA mismatch repair ATPase MutS
MEANKQRDTYQQRVDLFTRKYLDIKRNLVILSFLRFFTFILTVTSVVLSVKEFSFTLLAFIAFSFASFIFLVLYYFKRTDILNHFKNLIKINQDEIDGLKNDFSKFFNGENYINRDHEYSYDLDLFGEGSLFQYLNRTITLVGRELLANRLLNINSVKASVLEKRQEVIKELKSEIDWRHNFLATGYSCPVTEEDKKKIENWINDPVYFINKTLFKIAVVLLPVLTFLFLGLYIAEIFHYVWFSTLALFQLFFASALIRRTNKEQNRVSKGLGILRNYSKLIKLIEPENFNSELLKDLQTDLQTESVRAEFAFRKLIKIIDAFDTRLNIFVGFILNATLMWDLYSMIRLEKWKIKYGENIKQWVHVIAEFDFYCSMANYSYNNPDFVFPKVSDNTVLNTQELGHPLIPKLERVNNDYTINKGEIDIITGANMAGKSTFLRTVGINLILAISGVPVCAKKFEFRLMHLYSGMRTADSLKENESYFYAELKRLKNIIEKLKQGQQAFILLDEILKGTNSIDKAEGSWKFVEHLISLKATGIVATHDLTLCKLDSKYPDNIANKCFEVEIDSDKIIFDYKLRQGVTQNMNASLLMKQMGIFLQ